MKVILFIALICISATPKAPTFSEYATGVFLVKNFESMRMFPYKCGANKWTIGWGKRLDKKEVVSYAFTGINQEQANEWFIEDFTKAINSTKSLYPHLKGQRFWACVSLLYNCGANKIKESSLHKMILKSDWKAVAKQVLKWNKAKVKGRYVVLDGLTKRRKYESRLWLNEFNKTSFDNLQTRVRQKIIKEKFNPKITKDLIKLRKNLLSKVN